MNRPGRELLAFCSVLAGLVGLLLNDCLFRGNVLSPGDVLLATRGLGGEGWAIFEPANRLLIDPVLQFQPWLEFNRTMLREGRLPLWNPYVGCGAPHLANGQSGVFDPFHLIAYLGRLPEAQGWMAAARLWVAGLGMFLLCRRWGMGVWGRWYAGLTFPLCGFLVLWLLFPVTSSAVWMPWVLLATEGVLARPSGRRVVCLAAPVGATLLGGHVQTAAHVLLAAAAYVVWRLWFSPGVREMPWSTGEVGAGGGRADDSPRKAARLFAWCGGIALGVALAAVQVVPLGFYLARSPVWSDRERARQGVLEISRPRLLDTACTALPYLYGSQRRGHPNLARALGVHNLNESAGGYAGLVALAWLVPLGLSHSSRWPVSRFAAALGGIGFLGAYGFFPVENALRAVPVVNVIDHRRLLLWVAFALVVLGGAGLDALSSRSFARLPRWWCVGLVLIACGSIAVAGAVKAAAPGLAERARAHYGATSQGDSVEVRELTRVRAERQVRNLESFLPRYLVISAPELGLIAGLISLSRRNERPGWLPATAIGLSSLELLGFGIGVNPSRPACEERAVPDLMAYLTETAAPPLRVLAVGAELPPNCLMRYGLADLRNYDSVELSSNLEAFAGLYEPAGSRTSRCDVTWEGVARAEAELRTAGVSAVVGASPPPTGVFDRVDRVSGVWVGRFDRTDSNDVFVTQGPIRLTIGPDDVPLKRVSSTFVPGWRAWVDGSTREVSHGPEGLLEVAVAVGERELVLAYDPTEVRVALALSACAVGIAMLLGSGLAPMRDRGRKNPYGTWKPAPSRVRIDRVIARRPVSGSP